MRFPRFHLPTPNLTGLLPDRADVAMGLGITVLVVWAILVLGLALGLGVRLFFLAKGA